MNMASSSSSAMHFSEQTSYFSCQTASSAMHSSEQTSYFSCQTESEMESSKTHHWTDVDYSTTSSERLVKSNLDHYGLLKKDPELGRFFKDFPELELGEKISEGGQAEVYEARSTSHGPFDLVAKVMKGDALQDFQRQWPIGMLSAYNSYVFDIPLIAIRGATLLEDERVKGRFAFIMYRRWGDLQRLIKRRMEHKRSTVGPFFMDQVIELMSRIAEDMEGLHTKHDIIHRDLKASNVLVWGKLGGNVHIVTPSEDEKIESVVADFECSVGVLGTGIWRAPEILQQARARVPGPQVLFTRASDVYSYGMTCYEIISGHLPFEGQWEGEKEVLDGVRPKLPVELPSYLRSIIESCWQSDPEMRPNFSDICKMLRYKQGCNPANVRITSETNYIGIEVEHWANLQHPTLLQALERLLQLQLWVKAAKISHRLSTTGTIVQYFEVTDGEGSKVLEENIIAKIVKELSLPVKIEWIVERSEDAGFTAEGSDDADTTSETYLLCIMSSKTGEASLPRRISAILSEMNSQVYDVRCWNRRGLVECAFFAEGGQMDSLLPEIMAKEAGREAVVDCEITLRKLRKLQKRWVFKYLDGGNADDDTSFGQFLSLSIGELRETRDTIGEWYHVTMKSRTGGPSLLGRISAILTEMKVQVYEIQFQSYDGYVDCAVCLDARSKDAMLRQLLAKEAGSETPADCRIKIWMMKSGASYNLEFPDGKLSDLRAPRSPPAMRIHVGIDDSGFLPVRVICPESPENLVDVACSFSDSSILIERYEVPSFGGIKVPRSCMVEDTYFQNDDGERTRFEDFVSRYFKLGWNICGYRILHNDIEKRIKLKDYVDQYHIDGGMVELICKVGVGDLMQHLHENNLKDYSIDVAGRDYKKGLITFSVAKYKS